MQPTTNSFDPKSAAPQAPDQATNENDGEAEAMAESPLPALLADETLLKQQIQEMQNEASALDQLNDGVASGEASKLNSCIAAAVSQEVQLSHMIQALQTDPKKKVNKKASALEHNVSLIINEGKAEIASVNTVTENIKEKHAEKTQDIGESAKGSAPAAAAAKSSAKTASATGHGGGVAVAVKQTMQHAWVGVREEYHSIRSTASHAFAFVAHSAPVAYAMHVGGKAVALVKAIPAGIGHAGTVIVGSLHHAAQATGHLIVSIGSHAAAAGSAFVAMITPSILKTHESAPSPEHGTLTISSKMMHLVSGISFPHFMGGNTEDELGELVAPSHGMFSTMSGFGLVS